LDDRGLGEDQRVQVKGSRELEILRGDIRGRRKGRVLPVKKAMTTKKRSTGRGEQISTNVRVSETWAWVTKNQT